MEHVYFSIGLLTDAWRSNGGINVWVLVALAVWAFSAFRRQQWRQGGRRGGALLRTAMQLRSEGHTDLSTQVLCSLAVLHPRFAVNGSAEVLLQEQLDNPAHRAALILAYKSMHDQFPDNPGLSYKLAHLYHAEGRDSDALAILDSSLPITPDTASWKDRMQELRDTLQTIPEDAKPAADAAAPSEGATETDSVSETEASVAPDTGAEL